MVQKEKLWFPLKIKVIAPPSSGAEGYLAHKKPRPPWTLPQAYAWVLGGWAFSYERGTPVDRIVIEQTAGACPKRPGLANSPNWHLRVIEGKRACRLFVVEAGSGTHLH